ncbi:hypothetical protein TRICHSKD4_3014 [Roseibium sp. TrichSKD4]|uniref:hypothetical protein n=1 Tax=Roseibium sp. TrichSKD4 TaxID=744980 RepID=UPI0001E56A83|nr:hypothetical protein [Roseibium sp. TrichSKD4]EFO31919.1 hypothetical protein TRICHSKD4_3014 [Roseibium sp. TrichSKD4]
MIGVSSNKRKEPLAFQQPKAKFHQQPVANRIGGFPKPAHGKPKHDVKQDHSPPGSPRGASSPPSTTPNQRPREAEFLSRTLGVNGGRKIQGVGQPDDITDFFKKGKYVPAETGKFDALWETTKHQGRKHYTNQEATLLKSGNLAVGYPAGEVDGATVYGIMLFDRQGNPVERYNPVDKTVETYEPATGNWTVNRHATYVARTGGAKALHNYTERAIDLHSKAPTVLHAEESYWKSVGISDPDGYKVTFEENYQTTETYEYPSGRLFMRKGTRTVTRQRTRTLPLNEFLRLKNEIDLIEIKSAQHTDGTRASPATLRKIESGEYRADLQGVHDDLQEKYYKENDAELHQFYHDHPKIAAEKAHSLPPGKPGHLSKEGLAIIDNAYEGNGATRTVLPSIGGQQSSGLVLFEDKNSERSVLVSYNPLTHGSNVVEFKTKKERDNWFKNKDNTNTILSHFDAWELQDGLINSGAKSDLADIQGGDLSLLSFEEHAFGEELESELISRDKTMQTNNADVYIKSNAEKRLDIAMEILKPLILIGALVTAPLTAGASGWVAGLIVLGEAVVFALPDFVEAANADSEEERKQHFKAGLINLVLGLAIPLAAKGVSLIAKEGLAAAKGLGRNILSKLEEPLTQESPFLMNTLQDLAESEEVSVLGEVRNASKVPERFKVSAEELPGKADYKFHEQGYFRGLYVNSEENLAISLDGGETFIPVSSGSGTNEFKLVGRSTTFVRRADGSFDFKFVSRPPGGTPFDPEQAASRVSQKPASLPLEEFEMQELPSVPSGEPGISPILRLRNAFDEVEGVTAETRTKVEGLFNGMTADQRDVFLTKLETQIEAGNGDRFLRLAALKDSPEELAQIAELEPANIEEDEISPQPDENYGPFDRPLRKELNRIRRKLSPEDYQKVEAELTRSSPEDRKLFLLGIQNTKGAQKPGFARLWAETAEENRPTLVDAWTNDDPLAMKTYLRRTYGASELPEQMQSEIKEYIQSVADSNLSNSEATQRVKDFLTRKFPNHFPADGTLIKLVRVAKSNGSIAFWTLFGIGLSSWIVYELSKPQSTSESAADAEAQDPDKKKQSVGTNLGPGPGGEDPSTETARFFGSSQTVTDSNGVLRDAQGSVIGTYDKNGNLIKEGTKNEIIRPDGTPVGKYSTPTGYTYENPEIGREDDTLLYSVILNDNGDIVDANGNIVASRQVDHEGHQFYKLVADGSVVYIWWNDLYTVGDPLPKAENVERTSFWRTFSVNGEDKVYFYPPNGKPVLVNNVGDTS